MNMKKRKLTDLAVLGAKNLIVKKYEREHRRAIKMGKRVKRGTLARIIKEVMHDNNITGTKGITKDAIKQ